mgnify:CR=1
YHRWVNKSPTKATYMANSYEYKTFNVKFQVKKSMNPIVDEGERELHDRIKEHSSEGWRLDQSYQSPVDGGIHHTSWSQWKGKDKIRATSKGYTVIYFFPNVRF